MNCQHLILDAQKKLFLTYAQLVFNFQFSLTTTYKNHCVTFSSFLSELKHFYRQYLKKN